MPRLIDDVIYEVNAKFTTITNSVDSRLIGANPSGEGEGAEEVSDTAERVIDLVHGSRLVSTQFDKQSFRTYLKVNGPLVMLTLFKGYLKNIKERLSRENPERASIFENNVKGYLANVLKNLDDYEYFTGESMNPDGMVVLMNYREDGMTPYFVFFKDGLTEEKYVS
ncbi:unnamed protein product [Trichobilharzia regenti]|nr:unnamed protein product [Trichobilharzia regenti]